MTQLSPDEFLRLEALRLAVQAHQPASCQRFYDFLVGKDDRTSDEHCEAALQEIHAAIEKEILSRRGHQ